MESKRNNIMVEREEVDEKLMQDPKDPDVVVVETSEKEQTAVVEDHEEETFDDVSAVVDNQSEQSSHAEVAEYYDQEEEEEEAENDSNPDNRIVSENREDEDFIRSLSSIGSAGTILDDEDAEPDDEHENTIHPDQNLVKMRRNSVSTMNLPHVFTGSNRSIYTSIVLMPENGRKWDQLSERNGISSKFCVIPVLEDQVGHKMQPTDDLEESPEGASAESSLESNNPLRNLLARRAIAMQHSELSPVAEMPFGSAVDINQSMRDIRKAKSYGQVLPEKSMLKKNFLLQCLSFFFVYTGYVPIRGMQTSLNHQDNLGSITVSIIFASAVFGSLMCPVLVQRYGAKRTLCVSIIGFLVYAVGNLYASFYTLVPASIVFGVGFSCLLGSQGAYQTNLAAAYSTVTQTKIEKVLPFFGAIYFTFLQSANILGNGLGSTILKLLGPVIDPDFYSQHYQNVTNETDVMVSVELQNCGARFDNVFVNSSKFHVSPKVLYTLMGVMIFLILVSITLCTFFVDRLDCIFKLRDKSLTSHLKTVFSYHRDFKTLLLQCLAMYSAFGPSFVYGDVVKAFVTCPIGLDMIGYAIVCYATGSGTMAFTSGYISKLIGPRVLQYMGFAGSTCLYTTMLLWQPDRDKPYLIFILFGGLGMNDAIYQTKYYSMVGTLFAGRTETAYSFFLMYQSITCALVFALSPMLGMTIKLYLGLSFMCLTCLAYTLLVLRLRKERLEQKEITI